MTFLPADLHQLDFLLLSRAQAVVSLREVYAGNRRTDVIALRHDVDDNRDSFQTAQNMARWEAARGYRSTYFVLHGSSYWNGEPFFRAGLEEISLAGHEIGLHVNGIAEALKTGSDPHDVIAEALDELRGWGHTILGCASHGDEICNPVGFVNYDQFMDCERPGVDPYRTLTYRGRTLQLEPMPLSAFGLCYEAYHIPRGKYLSDTGGEWGQGQDGFSLEDFALRHDFMEQLHVLQHPDWWGRALSPERVAA